MDNTREKLIELQSIIACPNTICNFCEHFKNKDACEKHKKEVIADNMIANGVTIATDNNVGDKTNADRIRAMSDEVLAVFLECFGCCHYCSEHERLSDIRLFSDERCDEKCAEHCLEWLKQPVEVDNG